MALPGTTSFASRHRPVWLAGPQKDRLRVSAHGNTSMRSRPAVLRLLSHRIAGESRSLQTLACIRPARASSSSLSIPEVASSGVTRDQTWRIDLRGREAAGLPVQPRPCFVGETAAAKRPSGLGAIPTASFSKLRPTVACCILVFLFPEIVSRFFSHHSTSLSVTAGLTLWSTGAMA